MKAGSNGAFGAPTVHIGREGRPADCVSGCHQLLSGAEASRDGLSLVSLSHLYDVRLSLSLVASRFSAVFTSAFMTGYNGCIGALHTVEIGGDTAPGVLGAGLQHSGSLPVLPPQSVCR